MYPKVNFIGIFTSKAKIAIITKLSDHDNIPLFKTNEQVLAHISLLQRYRGSTL